MLEVNTAAALTKLAALDSLDAGAADDLVAALMLWRDVQGLLKLTAGEPFDAESATP